LLLHLYKNTFRITQNPYVPSIHDSSYIILTIFEIYPYIHISLTWQSIYSLRYLNHSKATTGRLWNISNGIKMDVRSGEGKGQAVFFAVCLSRGRRVSGMPSGKRLKQRTTKRVPQKGRLVRKINRASAFKLFTRFLHFPLLNNNYREATP